jgi:hypothetical protein
MTAAGVSAVSRKGIGYATEMGKTKAARGTRTKWTPAGSGLPNVQALDLLVEPDGAMLVATHGRGIWRLRPAVLGS